MNAEGKKERRDSGLRKDHQGRMTGKTVFSLCWVLALLMLTLPGTAFGAEGAPRGAQPADNGSASKTVQQGPQKTIAAKVNGVEITTESVNAMMGRISSRKGHGSPQPQDTEDLKKEALDRLIFQELAYQKAKAEGLAADPKDVETAIDNLKKKMGSEEEYTAFLEKEGFTEKELRSQIERGIIVKNIFDKEVYNLKTPLPEDALQKEYEKEKDSFVKPEKIVINDIVFFLDTHDKDSFRKAEEIIKKINADENKDAWKLVPDGTFAVRELEVRKERDPALYEEAKKLKKDEVSGVVITPDSLHVVQLKEYTPEKRFTLEQVRGTLESKLRIQVQKKRLQEWEAELRKDAQVEIMENGKESKQ